MFRHRLFYIISIWLVLTQTFPPINLFFPFGEAIKFIAFVVISLVLFQSLLTRRSVAALLVYGLMVFVYYLMGNAFFDTINSVLTVIPVMLSGLLIAEYALKYDKEYKYSKMIIITVLLCNVIMCFLTIPQIMLNPNIVRTSSREDYSDLTLFYWIIQYTTVHGLPILFAPLTFFCRRSFHKNKFLFFLLLFVILLLFYVVFKSNAATAFLMSAIMIIVGYLFNNEIINKKLVIRLIAVGLFGLLIMQPFVMEPILNTVQNYMDPSGASYYRIEDIKNSIVYGDVDGDLGTRQDLYSSSFDLFLSSPLWGTSSPQFVSRHTWIIDRLAVFGLLFIIPLVLVFVSIFKSVYPTLRHTKVIYICGFSCLVLMLFLKNDFGQGTWLYGFGYLPLLCRYIDYVDDDNKLRQVRP